MGGDAGGVEHGDAGVARAVVEIEQRELVLAAACDGVQSVERDEGVVVQCIERLAQPPRRRRERQVGAAAPAAFGRPEEPTSELQSLMRSSNAVFCMQKKTTHYSS